MAEKTINQLPDVSTLDNFYAIGSQENDGVLISCKYNLGDFKDTIDNTLSCVTGSTTIQAFDPEKDYFPGNICSHNSKNWKFTKLHTKGPWSDMDVQETNIMNELSSIKSSNSKEYVTFTVASDDNLLDVTNKAITIVPTDASTIVINTDSTGKASAEITKGTTYTASMGPQTGYYTPETIRNVYANVDNRSLSFLYRKDLTTDNCTVTATAYLNNSTTNILNGTNLSLFVGGSSYSVATVANSVATFNDVPMGKSCEIVPPAVSGYVKPDAINFLSNDTSIGVNIKYSSVKSDASLLWVYPGTYEEYTIEDWPDGDYSVKPVALHVNFPPLAESGFDYYVKPVDLTTQASLPSKQWATQNVLFPNVKIWDANKPYYNGYEATYYMLKDAAELGIQSPAAEYAASQYLDWKDGKKLQGYIGTRDQLNFLIGNVTQNYCICYQELGRFGWIGYLYSIWCSTPNGSAAVWMHNNGKWNGGNWVRVEKRSILPIYN